MNLFRFDPDVEFADLIGPRSGDIVDLFASTFAASDGAEEGALIGGMVQRMLTTTDAADLHLFIAEENGALLGACAFSRLQFDDPRTVFILSPVAVARERQGQGVGQNMLKHGLRHLLAAGVDVAVTYGDPAYYSRVGFRPVSVDVVPAPFALSQPIGWQAQTLNAAPMTPMQGPSRCVPALSDPALW